MDSLDQREEIKRLINVLRRVTNETKVIPFVYSSLYIISLAIYNLTSENIQYIIDALFYVSPVVIISFLVLSKTLRLCVWHRTACVLPIIPQAVSVFDYLVISLDDIGVYSFNSVLVIMTVLLLVAAYNVFYK